MNVLRIRGLVKSFTLHTIDGRTVGALRGVDLDVARGEHVALAGSSGAGKSSLLRCVYRTYVPTAGHILLRTSAGATVDLAALPDAQVAELRGRELGYVSQFLRAEPRRAVLDVVARAGAARGLDADASRDAAAAALRRLGIDERLWAMHTTVLSGGQKQRVNLAAGTISPPRLLLLDEPVSALDPVNREAVLSMIADLTGAGVAVLSVFHDLDAIERLATRVVVLADGRVAAEGPPAAVLRDSEPNLEVAR
ncbi:MULTISPECIES: ATP-binding cassette domain-containing protein [unclassified Nonomuraea]|uniref:ATP-binding cassette domain-containing protein n=1 Tax=unclassified Nonomuraea TaxID=2593643 RepID=UPI0035C063AF